MADSARLYSSKARLIGLGSIILELTRVSYIERPRYLRAIEPFVNKPIIKVLTGLRRVGKTTMLQMVRDTLLPAERAANHVQINLESAAAERIVTASDLTAHVRQNLDPTRPSALFLDEVQRVDGWERAVNAAMVDLDCDIYLTGSNSTLMSGELSTFLSGRYVEIEIRPFAFSEFTRLFAHLDLPAERLFQRYIQLGGMPFIQHFDTDPGPTLEYLRAVANTVIVNDVMHHHQIRDVDAFRRILGYVVDHVGTTFNANSITKYLKSEHRQVSLDTVLNYLAHCQEAYVLERVGRWDVRGKQQLRVDDKYFLTDHGFREARGYSNQAAIERVLENIVHNELRARGLTVQVGRVGSREVDFIATGDGQRQYLQVCYLMPTTDVRDREFGALLDIPDNHPKTVLSMDQFDFSRDGVLHRNLVDWLVDVE